VAFAGVFLRQLLDVSDLEFKRRPGPDGPDFFEAFKASQ
jgi:hypothetical protein